MKRIAILGCESSHAEAFISVIKGTDKFQNVDIVGVFSEEREAAEALTARFGVPVMENYDSLVGGVDGLVITARDGGCHYRYAKPYIKDGIPMFIDKPITLTEREGVEFMRELEAGGVRMCGGSALKHDEGVKRFRREAELSVGGETVGGYVRAPYLGKSPYGGFYFYAQHLVEMVCEAFGRFPISVTANRVGENISAVFHYDGYDVTGLFCEDNHLYHITRMSRDGAASLKIPTDTKEWYYREWCEFYELLCGGLGKYSYGEFIAPVFIMNAIMRSANSGKKEKIGLYKTYYS